MNATEQKPLEEILRLLGDDKNVFVAGCSGCPEGLATGGPQQVPEMVEALKAQGKTIAGSVSIDFLCNKALVGIRLQRREDAIGKADAILVMSCGVGVQAVGTMTCKRVVPALNTVSVGGTQGIFPSDERCELCGDCLLGFTGGICPITMCSKSLVNGTCGGTSKDGKCEVSPDKPCGWFLIYERLRQIGRLDDLKHVPEPRDHSKLDIAFALRKSTRWALENEQQEVGAAAEDAQKK